MKSFDSYINEWAQWYSGEPKRLWDYYNLFGNYKTRFWGSLTDKKKCNAVHMPLPQDIAETSANLLFSESPTIETDVTRLEEFLSDTNFDSFLLEAADVCAGLGGVYLKIDTKPSLSDKPILTAKSPTQTVPTFEYDMLTSVEFWRRVKKEDDTKILYVIEKRYNENGNLFIEYRLANEKGKEAEDNEIELPENDVLRNMSGLGVVYVPNALPNRLFLGSPQGVSDFAGLITAFDSLDETWTNWMADIELGKARIMIDKTMLDDNAEFDPNNEVYLKMDFDEWRMTEGRTKPIEAMQFKIRYREYAETAKSLTENIISRAGYAPASFGLNTEGTVESGAALQIKERKSMVTRRKKARYWQTAVEELLFQVQLMDNASALVGTRYTSERPNVTLSDSIGEDIKTVAETVLTLKRAEMASQETLVQMIHPEWSQEQVQEEIERLNEARLPNEILNAG